MRFTRRSGSVVLATVAAVAAFAYGCDDDDPTAPDDGAIGLELVAEGLTAPVLLVQAPDGTGRLFIVDQTGLIRVVGANGALQAEPFLDIRSKVVDLRTDFDERGLLGLAFHPAYATNGRFFVYYNAPPRPAAPEGYNNTARIAEFRVRSGNPNRADPASERVVLEVDEPQFNHNGGTVAFGPDGFLYISLGDGGNRDDEGLGHVTDWYAANAGGNGQDITSNLLGSILRIDVNTGTPYAIPATNPFVGTAGMDEIWAYGFRNPYRFSFDLGGANAMLVGDAGQELWEEVSLVTAGGNYGWNVKEGTHCFDAANPEDPPASCPSVDPSTGIPLTDPVIEFPNANQPDGLGVVVVGGNVYRGAELPGLLGQYLFGVWSSTFDQPSGRVFAATPAAGAGLWEFEELEFANRPAGDFGHYLLGFGQDLAGEVYLLGSDQSAPTGSSGKVYRIVEVD